MPLHFKLDVKDGELAVLKARLVGARFPDSLTDIAPWEDGTDPEYFKGFIEYWRDGYDWRAWEARLNEHPQFVEHVRDIDVHYIHVKAPQREGGAAPLPLLLLHGWPGSFFEFYKVIPMLIEDGRFDIVVPSLPGYGFSSAPTKRGCGVTAIAAIMDDLMGTLGYDKYIAQGGDWGGIIVRALAKHHHPRCAAIHTNMCIATPPMSWRAPWSLLQVANAALAPAWPLALTATELKDIQDLRDFQKKETAYQKIQGTKPQTLAFALADSPVGLASWILEKLRGWSDCGDDPEGAITKDEMLTNISIYYFGGKIASSMRLYKETLSNRAEMADLLSGKPPTPVGVAKFPKEIQRPPRAWAEVIHNVQQWTEMPRGGHFAALEQPRLLADDVIKFCDLARQRGWV